MFYGLDRVSSKIMDKAKKYSDFELEGYCIDVDKFAGIIEDLLFEIERLEEKIIDIENDRVENYKPLTYAEQIGVSDRDFI